MDSTIKCCDCECHRSSSSPGSLIRSLKRSNEELQKDERFSISELDDLDMFSNPKVHIENECELLRETVTNQHQTIQDLCDELEEERNASSTAADAAISMIQKLQAEKADIQMELIQFKRSIEEKLAYDKAEISALEDVIYQRDQMIQSLTFETQAYKHRMISYGLIDAEDDGEKSLLSCNPSMIDDYSEYDSPTYDYPPLKCSINENQDPLEADIYVADDENYPPGDSPHGREHLKTLDQRISQMETPDPSFTQFNGDFSRARTRDVSEQRPRHQRDIRNLSPTGSSSHMGASKELRPDVLVDSPRSECYSSKKLENVSYNTKDDSSEIEDDMSDDRVYTIDSVHHSTVSNNGGLTEQKLEDDTSDGNVVLPKEHSHLGDPNITKLYMRVQALEADRESMKQALMSMRTEKAQMVLLREIAQHLTKEVIPQRRLPLHKASTAGPSVFNWIRSFVSWKRKARRSKYMFGVSGNNIGLQILLEKVPRSRKWRCLRSTQV